MGIGWVVFWYMLGIITGISVLICFVCLIASSEESRREEKSKD